jgi:hypothetical protein
MSDLATDIEEMLIKGYAIDTIASVLNIPKAWAIEAATHIDELDTEGF